MENSRENKNGPRQDQQIKMTKLQKAKKKCVEIWCVRGAGERGAMGSMVGVVLGQIFLFFFVHATDVFGGLALRLFNFTISSTFGSAHNTPRL